MTPIFNGALRLGCLDQRLAAQTRLLKERNQSLLRAVGSVGGGTTGPSASTVVVGGEEYVSKPRVQLEYFI